MGVKVASASPCCFHWSPDHSLPSSSSAANFVVSPRGRARPIAASASFSGPRFFYWKDRSPFFGSESLPRSKSLGDLCGGGGGGALPRTTLRRATSVSSSDGFFGGEGDDEEEEFVRRIQELTALQPQEFDDEEEEDEIAATASTAAEDEKEPSPRFAGPSRIRPAPLAQVAEHEVGRMKGPLSSTVLGGGVVPRSKEEVGETVYCSAKKAFSSMVFIIRELQIYALHLRELLYLEDLQSIIARVHAEMQASFCWLFHQIFSCTPTLMVSVMLLLANFTVYSMGHTVALASAPSTSPIVSVSIVEKKQLKCFDPSAVKPLSSSSGRTASVGGDGGGGGKARPVAGETGDGRSPPSNIYQRRAFIPGNGEQALSDKRGAGGDVRLEEVPVVVSLEEEARAWKRMLGEAARMQAETRHEVLMDHDTLLRLVSPVAVEVEPDAEYAEYLRTDLAYQTALKQEPNSPLLLSNYAQFLYQVAHDLNRAEYYFKRAIEIEPADAEALGRYANFLWLAKNDLGAAEETFLEAIAADPGNTNHAANYAHFLWNTGGEDTCFMLEDGNEDFEEA